MLAGRRTEVEQAIRTGDDLAYRARPSTACCPGRAADAVRPAGVDCRAGAGQSSVRPGRTVRRSGRCRPGWPGEFAAPLRPRGSGRRRLIVRYSRPTSTRNCSRLRTSRTNSPAILRSVALGFQSVNWASRSPSGLRHKSSIVSPRSRTAEASSRSRLPAHVEHSTSSTRWSSFERMADESRDASSSAG